jgi:hypothetical protein
VKRVIVLSVGMPRAGSGWHYNLIQGLMQTTGCADAGDIRRRFHLEHVLTEVNCNIGVLSARRLAMVSVPALLGNTFVIKAHAGPTIASRLVRAAGLLRITYIYRDPRDAMLSAIEYGRRASASGRPNAFSQITNFDQALDFIAGYVEIWKKWIREQDVPVWRYEDLLNDYVAEAGRLVKHLRLDSSMPEVQAVIAHYGPERAEGKPGTHFSKGRIGRFREAFTAQQQAALAERFGAVLTRMGYAI